MKSQKQNYFILLSFCTVIPFLFFLIIPTPVQPVFTDIPDHTAVVTSEAELYSALASPEITTIHLGANITLTSEVFEDYAINPQKPFLILDGTNPYVQSADGQSLTYTLTDHNSNSEDRVIRLRASGVLQTITVQNMDIIGRNYFGIVCSTIPGLSIYYENITYSGPQLTYNINGSAYYHDCDITITQNGISPTGEVAEAATVSLSGNILIDKSYGGADEIFWLKESTALAPAFTIEPGAYVEVTHNQTPSGGLIYCSQAGYPITIGSEAVLIFHGYQFVVESAIPGSFTVEEKAQVYIDFKTTGDRAALYTKNMTINKDAVFHMTAGPSSTTYSLLGITTGGSLIIDHPASVLLRMGSTNTAAYLIKSEGTPTFDIQTEQVNYWSADSDGGLANLPDYHWKKHEETLWIKGLLNGNGNYTGMTTNYDFDTDARTPSWLSSDQLSSNTLNGSKARVLSFGTLPLTASYHTDNINSYITGATKANSLLQGKLQENESALYGPTDASETGSYALNVNHPLKQGDVFMLLANNHYLYQEETLVVPAPVYRITYAGNGSTAGTPPEDTAAYESGSSAFVKGSHTLSKEGFRFAGWSRQEDASEEVYQEGDPITVEEDIILYAVWEKTYNITYVKNDPLSDPSVFPDPGGPYSEHAEITLVDISETGFTKEGFSFLGWTADLEADPPSLLASPITMPANDLTLYAIWKEDTVSFTFVKIDETDHTSAIPDVTFSLYRCGHIHDEECGGIQDPELCSHAHDTLAETQGPDNDCWHLYQEAASNENGLVQFDDLVSAEYQLAESKTAPGYQLPLGQWRIIVNASSDEPFHITAQGTILPPGFMADQETGALFLPNERITELPLTGSSNHFYFYSGIILIGLCLAYIYKKTTRYERRQKC